MSLTRRHKILLLLVLALLAYFPLFLHLDNLGLYRWDEARNAVNAFEMAQGGNLLLRTYEGQPDHFETKPPMLVWLQAGFMKLFGYGELSVRLPAALAALGTLAMILLFFIRVLGSWSGGLFACLALLTAEGYVTKHVARSGDHDALLIFFLMAFLFSFYLYLHRKETPDQRWLWAAAGALIGGVLTKSIAGLFFLPGAFLYLLVQRKLLVVLRDRHVYFALAAFAGIVGGYYLLRERLDPGYLYWVSNVELLPRYLNTSEELTYHDPPSPWYYLELIREVHFRYFWWFIPLSLLLIYLRGHPPLSRFALLVALTLGSFLLVISLGSVNPWYDAPAIPLLAILTGAGLALVLRALHRQFTAQAPWKAIALGGLFTISIFALPYATILEERVYMPRYSGQDVKYGAAMEYLERHAPQWKRYSVYYECFNAHPVYYLQVYNTTKEGYRLDGCGPCDSIAGCPERQPGDLVLLCNPTFLQQFTERYEVVERAAWEGCRLLEVMTVRDGQ